jgi:drug/metabolite transporter (DMT)-like permease
MQWDKLLGAIGAFGFWGLFLTLASRSLTPMATQFAYSASNLVMTSIAALTLGMPFAATKVGVGWAVLASFCGIVGGMCTLFALQSSPNPGLVNVVVHACPIVTLALTMLFLQERVTLASGAGVLLVISGLVLIALKN